MSEDRSPEPTPAAAQGGGSVGVDPDHITTSTRDPGEMARQLEQWLAGILGSGSEVTISDVSSPASNGMSSETLLFSAAWSEGGKPVERQLVARIEPPATDHPVFTTYDLDMQYRVMRLVHEHTDVPVPETFWYEPDPAVLGGSFFVMARVDGLVPPDVLPYTFGDNWVFDGTPSARQEIQESAIRAMAGIHSLTPDRYDLSFLEHKGTGTSLQRCLDHWVDYYQWVVKDSPSPLLADCFAWLADNMPTDASPDALSWGDGRIGNMMFRRPRRSRPARHVLADRCGPLLRRSLGPRTRRPHLAHRLRRHPPRCDHAPGDRALDPLRRGGGARRHRRAHSPPRHIARDPRRDLLVRSRPLS
jgi:aminoglycoside phosphotransferase (APT) family kinase protein